MKIEVKIIKQLYLTPQGERISYGVVIDGVPRITFYSTEELNAFLHGVNGQATT